MAASAPKTCQRCGKRMRRGDHPNVIYCSGRCSRPTAEEFEARKAAHAVAITEATPQQLRDAEPKG